MAVTLGCVLRHSEQGLSLSDVRGYRQMHILRRLCQKL